MVVTPGVMTALEKAWEMMAWTVSSRSRYIGHHLREPMGDELHGQAGYPLHPGQIVRTQSPLQGLPLPGPQAVGEGPVLIDVHGDGARDPDPPPPPEGAATARLPPTPPDLPWGRGGVER